MERWVIEESEYNKMIEQLMLLGINADMLDDLATDYLDKGTHENECYIKAFNDLLEKSKEK